ncbi:long-chain-fatty-acid--CoA ligase, partial [Xanthovirga aplysinae]|uniref:long-chain-fatty-acid--CoA ligase n=1 Tax=Xanthovirga aplysinae TaxID=2529853 RepID=UPI0012BCF9C9
TAFIFNGASYTYSQINAAANQVAKGLANEGIQKGDKVALSCLNLPYFPIIYFGILKAGGVVVPLNVLLKKNEIIYHLQDCDAKAYFCFEGTPELPMGEEGFQAFESVKSCEHFFTITADPKATSPFKNTLTLGQLMHGNSPQFESTVTQPEDTAVILYTSGTTGQPKGAELTHFNMFQNAQCTVPLLDYQEDDIYLIVLPLFHSFGQTVQMNAGILKGITQVLLPRFEPSTAFNLLQKEKVSVFCGVPTMYWGLLNFPNTEKFDLQAIADNLRICVSGGASMPVQLLKDFQSQFNVPILEGYGLSETSPVACFNHLDRVRKPGSIGTPLWGVQMKIVNKNMEEVPVGEAGEIIIRGHNVMKGYYKRPDANKQVFEGNWFHTGDVGKMDDEGFFYIVDRTKDMIIRGGYNVYPREIEEALIQHEAVSLAAVIGIPHDTHGEEIKAYVILKEGANTDVEELIHWTKERIASYKYPRIIEIVDSLPMTATGKILKKELRKMVVS